MRVVGLLTVVGRLGLDRGIVALGTAVSLTRSSGTTLTVSVKTAALAVIITVSVKAATLAIVSVSAETAALTVVVTVEAAFTVSSETSLTVIIAVKATLAVV